MFELELKNISIGLEVGTEFDEQSNIMSETVTKLNKST